MSRGITDAMRNSERPSKLEVFNRYADYYDAMYSEKDYEGESRFVLDLLKRHNEVNLETLLDIGCGTGGHTLYFAQAGLKVTGLDISETMVRKAEEKIATADRETPKPWSAPPVVKVADVRSFRKNHQYDAAVAMFAVVGYLTGNTDLLAAFGNIRTHLRKGGCFVFDIWFGPAVYSQRPETRIKEAITGDSRTIRLATPETDPTCNVVRVNYTILELKDDRVVSEVRETHEMRFFFIPELELLLLQSGLEMVEVCPFMERGRAPGTNDWNISVVARAT
jgi:SAM-dependent methyltransferase